MSSSSKGGNFGAAGRAPSCKDKVRIRAWLEAIITDAEPLSYTTDRKLKATNKEVLCIWPTPILPKWGGYLGTIRPLKAL
jgi:hypothetical protein